jgi:hypothetical protein
MASSCSSVGVAVLVGTELNWAEPNRTGVHQNARPTVEERSDLNRLTMWRLQNWSSAKTKECLLASWGIGGQLDSKISDEMVWTDGLVGSVRPWCCQAKVNYLQLPLDYHYGMQKKTNDEKGNGTVNERDIKLFLSAFNRTEFGHPKCAILYVHSTHSLP